MRFHTANLSDACSDPYAIMPLTDPNDTSSFVAIDTARIVSLSDYSQHTVSFINYYGPHGHIAFKAPFQSPVNRPYIDDIILDVRPCSPIDDLHVVYTTTDSIVIAWTDSLSTWIDSTSSSASPPKPSLPS